LSGNIDIVFNSVHIYGTYPPPFEKANSDFP